MTVAGQLFALTAAARWRRSFTVGAFLAVLSLAPAYADPQPTLLWQHYPGSVKRDTGDAVAIDTLGNILVGGQTFGSIGRRDNNGTDAFVIKYSPDGEILWRRQPGPARSERLRGLATDFADNVIAVGETNGAVGGPNRGLLDGFIVKYAADGKVQWKRQFGAAYGDTADAVAADSAGNIIVVGVTDRAGPCCETGDAIIIKYAADGTETWRRTFDLTGSEEATAVTTNAAGDIFVAGYTANAVLGPNFGTQDTFIARLAPDGTTRWVKQQMISGDQLANGIAIDETGRLFLGGSQPNPTAGFYGGFVAAFSGSGAELWRRGFGGETAYDDAWSVAIDTAGHVLVSGSEAGETIMSSYARDGALRWKISPQRFDRGGYAFLAADGTDHVALVGTAEVSRAAGHWNANVARYDVD